MATEFSISLAPPWNGEHVVRVVGELDLATMDEVDRFLARLQGAVCLDCRELRFIDGAGLRSLLQSAARLESLRLVNVAPTVRRVFELTETTSLLEPMSRTNTAKGAT